MRYLYQLVVDLGVERRKIKDERLKRKDERGKVGYGEYDGVVQC